MTSVGIVLVGAGSGSRLGASTPKAFVPVGDELMIVRALRGCLATPSLTAVSVVVPAERLAETETLITGLAPPSVTIVVTAGGASRELSVTAGLAALPPSVDIVLVHDAARCLTPPAVFHRVVEAVTRLGHGVVPVLPVVDTVKVVDAAGVVVESPDRSRLAAVQTPQGFPRPMLIDAYNRIEQTMTDDAGTVAAAGNPVSTVPGDPLAFKITTSDDLARAQVLLNPATATLQRIGSGFDAHRFAADAPLWLAGLHWPGVPGLAGHSDGDVVCHALCDALLAAAGLGDLGSVFGTADPKYRGAHGDVFVLETAERVRQAGWTITNCTVQLIAAAPRLSARRLEAQELLTTWVGAPVNLSATTTDGMGFTGAGEGAVAMATALLQRSSVPPAPSLPGAPA